jgi:hypothetical protein
MSGDEQYGTQQIMHYAVVVPVSLDGKIQQVHWQIGGRQARTVVYYNTDTDIYQEPHPLRRLRQETRRHLNEG